MSLSTRTPTLNLDVINTIRKKPSIEYFTGGPSPYCKGIVLKCALDNPWQYKEKIAELTGLSSTTILNCLNLFEDSGFISAKKKMFVRRVLDCYAITDDEEVLVRVKRSIEKAPKCEPETHQEKALRRIPLLLKKKGLTEKMLVEKLAIRVDPVYNAIKILEKDGLIYKTKPKEVNKRNSPVVYNLTNA